MSTADSPVSTSDDRSTADWSVWLGTHLESSTQSLNRMTDLSLKLMKKVADGDIAPAVVESHAAAFMAENAQPFADEMAALITGFLTDLIGVNVWFVRALLDRADTAEPTSRPDIPRYDRSSGQWMEAIDDYAKDQSASLRAILDGIVDNDHDQLPTPLNKTAHLFFDLLSRWDGVSASYGQRYLETMLGLTTESDRAPTTLHAVAPLGQTATVKFALGNNTDVPADVRCVLTDVRRTDGVGHAFEPDATVMPNRFGLSARAEEVLTLSVRLAEPEFAAGPIYSGGIRVFGVGNSVIDIPVSLRASILEAD